MAFPVVVAGAPPIPTAPVVRPQALRIGPTRHEYEYTRLNADLWKCKKHNEWGKDDDKLFLLKDQDYWVALDAPENLDAVAEVLKQGHPMFRTSEDALSAGWHKWESNDAGRSSLNWRDTGLSCDTTVIL